MKNIPWLFSILLLFVPSVLGETQSVPADIAARLRREAQMTYLHTQIPQDEERAAAVLFNGSAVYTMVTDQGGKFSLPLDIMLLFHTHHYGVQRSLSSTAQFMLGRGDGMITRDSAVVGGSDTARKTTSADSGVGQQLPILVYNFAHVEAPVLAEAQAVATQIFAEAGVEATWINCPGHQGCGGETIPPEFRVRILQQGKDIVSNDPLGSAIFCERTADACVSYVFYGPIHDLSEKLDVRSGHVLGQVMAHEVGHALLGRNAHALFGIMQARLPTADLDRMLYFTPEQAKRLRADLSARKAYASRRKELPQPFMAPKRMYFSVAKVNRVLRRFRF